MEEIKIQCALCKIILETIEFNLKVHNSNYSHTPLITLLENITGKFSVLHYDICLQCYALLNELDAIELRQVEIQNQFKKYLAHLQNTSINLPDIPEYKNAITNEINDIGLLSSHEVIENKLTDLFTETNSTTVEPKLEDCSKANEENKPTVSKSSTLKKKGKRNNYSGVLKPYKCHCLKEFRTSGELKNHMNSHNDQRAFVCEICGQSYKHKTAFNIHMDMHNGINPFVCVYCNKSFTQKGALVRHVPIHTGDMPFQCDECGKRFVHHTSFNIHRLSHKGLKSYKCDLCGLALRSGSHLKRHMRIHTGEKKFVCSTCGKSFAEKYNLAVHEKLHTNSCLDVPQKRNNVCQICGISFKKQVKLDVHLSKDHQIVKTDLINTEVLKPSFSTGNNSCIPIISNG